MFEKIRNRKIFVIFMIDKNFIANNKFDNIDYYLDKLVKNRM